MAERLDIEDFLGKMIAPDLCQYAYIYYFPESGFATSSITIKYWLEQGFHSLSVYIPEGHRPVNFQLFCEPAFLAPYIDNCDLSRENVPNG